MSAAVNAIEALVAQHGGVALFDGAMGTMLQNAGLAPGACPELWNADRAADVSAVHAAYLRAGSHVISTNTFGANRLRLRSHAGVSERAPELARLGAALARRAAQEHADREHTPRALVAGSVGPTGDILAPLGTLAAADAEAAFEEQARALAEGGADVILCETFSALDEARAAIAGAKKGAPALPVVVTMTFAKRQRTAMGVRPSQLVALAREMGVAAAGFNCGLGPAEALAVARLIVEAAREPGTAIATVAQANAGLPKLAADGMTTTYEATPESMAAYATAMREAGIVVIGACCGSTPAHIRAMATALGQRSWDA